ncbi:MAG: T9SS type A sorting domain-containing protein [Bacteroidota bacterium]
MNALYILRTIRSATLVTFLLVGFWGRAQHLEFVYAGESTPEITRQLSAALGMHPNHERHRISAYRQHVWLRYSAGAPIAQAWCADLLARHGLELVCFYGDDNPANRPGAAERFRACREAHLPPQKAASFNTCATPLDICDNSTLNATPWGAGAMITTSPNPPKNPEYGPFSGPSPWTNPWNGGTNYGCLQSGELNTIWTRIVVTGNGNLEWAFTFPDYDGFNFIYMDWSLFPLTPTICADLAANNANSAPLRCNWNDFPATPTAATGMSALAASIPIATEEDNFEVSFAVTSGQQFLLLMDNWSAGTFTGTFDFSLSNSSAQVCGTVLPAGHTELVAEVVEAGIQLGWIHLGPSDFAATHLERAGNTGDFAVLREISASEFAHVRQLTDQLPPDGLTQYRIRRTDHNGQVSYSNTVEIAWEGRGFRLYPQPTTGAFHLQLHEAARALHIYDAAGRRVHTQDLRAVGTAVDQELDPGLAPGWYAIEVVTRAGKSLRKRLVVH